MLAELRERDATGEVAAIYEETSPQMVVFGRMIGEALPAAQGSAPGTPA
jgi:hypothetical protein